MPRGHQKSDDDKVKDKLVKMIENAGDKDWDKLVALANAYTKLRAVELKQDEGDWGTGLDAVSPADTNNAAQVRS